MKFAKYTFLIAAIYGFAVLIPQYFLEDKNGRDFPPAITHPEYFYGFVGVALAFQVAFLIIAGNPARYRQMMIPSAIEKFSFAAAVFALFATGRVAAMMVGIASIDLIFGILFVLAFWKTNKSETGF